MWNMQMNDVDFLIERKRNEGNLIPFKECEHKNLIKEYFAGTFSDYVCLDCGVKAFNKSYFKE